MKDSRRVIDENGSTEIPTRIKNFTESGERIVDIQCALNHTMASSDRGRVYAWGDAKTGQLGLGYHARIMACEP